MVISEQIPIPAFVKKLPQIDPQGAVEVGRRLESSDVNFSSRYLGEAGLRFCRDRGIGLSEAFDILGKGLAEPTAVDLFEKHAGEIGVRIENT